MKHMRCTFLMMSLNVFLAWILTVDAQPIFDWPVESAYNRLSATFGEPRTRDANPFDHWHKGIDIPRSSGIAVHRSAEGTVTFVGATSVVIHHGNGWHTRLVHVTDMSSLGVIEGQEAPAIVGTVAAIDNPHVHAEVYKFDGMQYNESLQYDYREARNPLLYANFTSYPDADTPTAGEIRFNTYRTWSEVNTSLDANGRFIDVDPNSPYFPTYFIAHAYDDLTSSGATAPYKIRFSVEERASAWWGESWEEVWSKETLFDGLLAEDGTTVLALTDVYADGSNKDNKNFDYYLYLDFCTMLDDGKALNATGLDQSYRFRVQAFDKAGKVNQDAYRDLIVPPATGPTNPSVFVDDLRAAPGSEGVEVTFGALWVPGIAGLHIWRSEGQAYRRITSQMLPVPDPGSVRHTFRFPDREVAYGRVYAYKLGVVGSDGTEQFSDDPAALSFLPGSVETVLSGR